MRNKVSKAPTRRRIRAARAIAVILAAMGAALGLLALWQADRAAVEGDFRLVKIFPHDPSAFTQGLLFHDGYLYESTGLYGESSLRKVNLETGEVLMRRDIEPEFFGEGLALWGDRLIMLTWREGVAFLFDRETFAPRGQFPYRSEGWGLTHDGRHLIMSDGSATLQFRHPETFQVVRTLGVTDAGRLLPGLNELEYVQGEILANIWKSDRVARIAPDSGEVAGWIDLSPLRLHLPEGADVDVLNGIAWDAAEDRLFVTGKRWPLLFEIAIAR